MKKQTYSELDGYTFIELLMVISIIGALASIATPHYVNYRQKAKAAACLSNRRNIEAKELAYFASNSAPNLSIGNNYACPSRGIYVWLVSDPENQDYPKVACSVHYAGAPPDETTPPEENSPVDGLNDLITKVNALGLKAKGKEGADKLIKNLEDAIKEYNKGNNTRTDKKLADFKKEVNKNKTIAAADKTTLVELADTIQKQL